MHARWLATALNGRPDPLRLSVIILLHTWPLSDDTGKITKYDKIVIENKKKRENMEIKIFFLHKFPSKRWFRNGIHSFYDDLKSDGWNADIIHYMW